MSDQTDRLSRLRDTMRDQSIDLVAIAPGAHMAWLLDVRPHGDERPCIALISRDKAAFLMPRARSG